MHDAILVEKAGVPAAAIMTDKFAPTARAMAELNGLSGYPFAVIAHPIANNDDAVLRAKAAEAVRQCIAILIERSAAVAPASARA